MGAALVCIDSVTSMNFHFFLKNTQSLSLPKIYRALKLFDFGPLSVSYWGGLISCNSKLLLSAENVCQLEMPCVCACQFDQLKLCQSSAQRARQMILHSKNIDCLLEQPFGVIAQWPARAQTWTLQHYQELYRVLLLWNQLIIFMLFKFFLGQL